MTKAKAVKIFKNINSEENSILDKGIAIFEVKEMETFNSITKDEMMDVVRFLYPYFFKVVTRLEDDDLEVKIFD